MQDSLNKCDFNSLVKGYHDLIVSDPKNKITPEQYFNQKLIEIEKHKSAIEEKAKQVETVCETKYGMDSLSESVRRMQSIQGQFQELERRKDELAEFTRNNAETINCSQKYLKKILWLYHYNQIQKMPEELYNNLKSKNSDEVLKANDTIKSFALLYQKHSAQLKIPNLIDNPKIIDAANELIFAFDFDAQFNMKDVDDKKRIQLIIENSINATAFLMNYTYLFNLSNPDSKKDPLDIFGFFLFSWKKIINNKIRASLSQKETPLFTSEFEIYLRAKLVLDNIDPRNVQFSQKLVPNILPNTKKLENELEKRFLNIEQEIIRSFYFVQDNYFSGSFFNNFEMIMSQILISYGDEYFEGTNIRSIAVIIRLEKFIKQHVSNMNPDYSVQQDISLVDLMEFKTKVVKDISSILLYYFSNSNILPKKMLEILLDILFVIFVPYYTKAKEKNKDTTDPLASIILMCKACNTIPFICSAWSNQLINEIKKCRSNILSTLNMEIRSIFHRNNNLYYQYQTFIVPDNKDLPFSEKNIIKRIEESLVGIITQECIDIQDSFPDNNYSEAAKKAILGFEMFLEEFLRRNSDDQKINEMAVWTKQKVDEIKKLFH